MRNLRFVLEDLNDRGRAVEPNRLSPTGGGFTGLEALLQYFFVQSQAINIYDSKGFLLKLNLLLNECSQYTNAQTAIEQPRAHRRAASSGSGPTSRASRRGAVARTTPNKPRGTPRDAETRRPAAGAGRAPAPAPGAPPAAAPAAAARRCKLDPRDLLDKLLPPASPTSCRRRCARRAVDARRAPTSERNLLDYLLGP